MNAFHEFILPCKIKRGKSIQKKNKAFSFVSTALSKKTFCIHVRRFLNVLIKIARLNEIKRSLHYNFSYFSKNKNF